MRGQQPRDATSSLSPARSVRDPRQLRSRMETRFDRAGHGCLQERIYLVSSNKQEILREFRLGLHDRINRRIDGFPGTLRPRPHSGTRKYDYQWQVETYRAAIQLNQPRLIIHWLPPWLKTRF